MVSVLLAVLSGLLGALGFPTPSLWPLILVALVPLLVVVPQMNVRQAFTRGWLTGVVGFLIAFSWALPTIARFEHTSELLALPFFALFIAYYAVQVGLFAAGVAWVRQGPRPAAVPVMFAAAWWVVLEWGFPKVIPWSFGDTLAPSPLLRQAADLGGVYGLSFLILLVNASVAAAVVRRDASLRSRLRFIGAGVALLAVWVAYGAERMRTLSLSTQHSGLDGELNVAIVQGGLHSGRSDLAAANEEAWTIYSSLSTPDATLGTDLIVWPETVLRVYLRQDDSYRQRVVDLLQQLNRPLFVGSLDLPPDGPGELNSGYLIERDGNGNRRRDTRDAALGTQDPLQMQIYHKVTLLPFGEYVPGMALLPLLSRWQTTGQFVAGQAPHPLTLAISQPDREEQRAEHESPFDRLRAGSTRRTTFAPSICFEAIWPGAFNQLVRDGAEFLINLTDDGWFGNSAGPYQHLQAATLRAVETRRWLARASNSGVSAFVDPTGRIVASLPLGAVGVLPHRIGTSQALPPYVRWGNWPILLCLAVVIAGALSKRWVPAPDS